MRRLILGLVLVTIGLPLRAGIDIQEITTPGGLNVWLVEDHSIPFVALEMRFLGGTTLDAPDKTGVGNLMMGLLEEGSDDLDSRGFAKAVEEIAASFSYNIHDDSASISAKFLTENRDRAMELLRGSMINPTFPTSAIDRVRAQVVSGIQSDEKDPDAIAHRAMDKIMFGDHPYSATKAGTLETIANITRQDIISAHQEVLTRDRVYISAVGDITADALAQLVDDLMADLPAQGPKLAGPVDVKLTKGTTIVEFDTPQSVAIFAQEGIDNEDPDFFAAYLLNVILGGGSFESRLMTEVREKRGLTYGVYSYHVDKAQADLWMGSVASANDRIAEAIAVVKDEWAKMQATGVSAKELQDAKTFLTGAYPLRFDGNAPIANIMVYMQVQGLAVDYIETRNDKVNAVTLEDINRVAKQVLNPEGLRFVVVGKPEGLEE